ncbi:MAG: PHP domain-containing protein [Candidatus Omnitrophica bacterium]|nr:PHP domain-containing protein [Candidatus Omnitrophota bacterium]
MKVKTVLCPRFSEVSRSFFNRDCQVHTAWTDGACAPREILKAAEDLGLDTLAFTEHIRSESVYFKDFFREIEGLRKGLVMKVFIGVETKVIDEEGQLDISSADYAMAEIVLGSVHRIPHNGGFYHPRDLGLEVTLEEEFRYLMAMLRGGRVDVLAHPFGMSLRMFNVFSTDHLEEVIRTAALTGVAFEFNSKYASPVFLKEAVRFCRKHDPLVSLGSDVHKIEDLGRCRGILEGLI